jgi:hypothetical protein
LATTDRERNFDIEATRTHYADGNTQGRARRGLTIFFAVVVALSAPIQAVIIAAVQVGGRNGLIPYLSLIAALMFVPTIASVVARLALKEGFSDVSFRLGGAEGVLPSCRRWFYPFS